MPAVATWDDVDRVCAALPATVATVSAGGDRQWRVRDRTYLWERPLRSRDRAELGAAAVEGPVLAASVPDEGAKRALVADEPDVYFTTSHFDGYAAVLCRLERLTPEALTELAGEAWACRAPKRLRAQHLG